jgi:DNA-binding NtrC family response regulator
VTQPPAAPTVWIVDDDLGFVWWLGEIFSEAGCRPVPALSCADAVNLSKRLSVGVDVLVLNPELPGVAVMLRAFRRWRSNFKVVAIDEPSDVISVAIHPHAYLKRPSSSDPISRADWVNHIRKLLKEVAAAAAV